MIPLVVVWCVVLVFHIPLTCFPFFFSCSLAFAAQRRRLGFGELFIIMSCLLGLLPFFLSIGTDLLGSDMTFNMTVDPPALPRYVWFWHRASYVSSFLGGMCGRDKRITTYLGNSLIGAVAFASWLLIVWLGLMCLWFFFLSIGKGWSALDWKGEVGRR